MIRKEKKADIIIKKLGATPTLESAAAAYNKTIQQAGADSTITFSTPYINGLGMENTLVGAAFSKKFSNSTTPAFAGNSGVFVMKVNSRGSKPADSPEIALQQKNQKLSTLKSQINNWYEGLKKLADIEDNRSKLY
jgi:hypothetical protein